MSEPITILMSIYAKEQPAYFQQALESLKAQTLQNFQIVLVLDGPLTPELREVIAHWQQGFFAQRLHLVPLPTSQGLARALNAGLEHCVTEWVARMDTDDFSEPERLERQAAFMEAHPEIGVISSALYEFVEDPAQPHALKPVRSSHQAIVKQFPYRNPLNHPAVMFRASLVRQAGGYQPWPLMEDYYLWARMLSQGVRFYNDPCPLVRQRFNQGTLQRRGGWENFKQEVGLRTYFYRQGLCSKVQWLLACGLQMLLRLTPAAWRGWFWHKSRRPLRIEQRPAKHHL